MMQSVKKLLKQYSKSNEGNFALMAAIFIFVIVLVVAVAIDTARLTQASTKLKDLTDNAAFAAAEGQNRSLSEREAIFEEMMRIGIENSPELSVMYDYNLTYDANNDADVLTATSRAEAKLIFPMTKGNGKFVSALSEVTAGREQVEVALVLDISNSMNGSKIIELRNAATSFVQTLMGNQGIKDRVKIAIIPYGGSVRLPNDLNFMLNQPAPTQHWIGNQWNGCLSITPFDYKTGITPQDRLDFLPDFTAFAQQNSWCPPAGNEMIGLSDNETTLIDKIAGLTLSDGTATDIGTAWGLAALDPRWRGQIQGMTHGSPRNFNARTLKIMIVMTDGGITGQRYPTINELASGPPPVHTSNEISTGDEAHNGYEDICDLIKTKNIETHTISFDLNNDQFRVDRLQYCGTSAAHNHEADLGQLTTTFENIAASIQSLRLSR